MTETWVDQIDNDFGLIVLVDLGSELSDVKYFQELRDHVTEYHTLLALRSEGDMALIAYRLVPLKVFGS